MLDQDSSLRGLLGDQHAQTFLRSAFPHSPWHAQLDEARLPSWLRSPFLKEPRKWDATYQEMVEVTRGDRKQYRVQGAPVSAWVDDLGMAVHLRGVDKYLDGAPVWLRGLERELGLPDQICKMSAFVNAPGVGLGAHCDPSEHLLLHTLGRKRVRILPSPRDSFLATSHSLSSPPSSRVAAQYTDGLPGFIDGLPAEAEEIELTPGSVLFMPRGCYHETVGGTDAVSCTVVVQFRVPSYADVFAEYLYDYLLQNAEWRRPIVGAWSAEEHERLHHQRALSELLCTTATKLAGLDSARILARAKPTRIQGGFDLRDRWVRNPSVLVQRIEARGALRFHAELGLGASEEVTLGGPATQLVLALASVPEPRSGAQLVETYANWTVDALATIVQFLVRKRVLIPLTVEPYDAVPPAA